MPVQSIIPDPDDSKCQVTDAFDSWLRQLLERLQKNHQRYLLSCEGSEQWCRNLYAQMKLRRKHLLLLSDQDGLAYSKSETLLGQESRLVVVDLFSGLNPDVLCIAAGLVQCGGLLVLLSPGGAQWQQINDRYGIWQDQTASPENTFVDYFFGRIEASKAACMRLRENADLPEIPSIAKAFPTDIIDGQTSDQALVLEGIENWLNQTEQRIALVTANRGRGKSTCLGFLVKIMTEDRGLSVCVTAYSRQSAAMLLAQCDASIFTAPDGLIDSPPEADVLVIDEAAMLPFAMLDRLCRQYQRVVMATTTGGYEGTGQGFLLRFIARLPKDQVSWFELHQPVRWADDDCLESWIDDTFLLKPELPLPDGIQPGENLDLSRCRYDIIDRLSAGIELKQIYQLMVLAHYRTRPSDFRALMENPDLIPLVARYQSEILGVALLNREGGFSDELSREVFLGRRRPKGHLLAQMLTAQAGLRDFAVYRGLRIQRIAVSENWRRQGIGSALLETVAGYASENGYDYIGASFAFDNESAGFWRSCGFRLVHIGYGQGKSSGSHSVAVIKVLNPLLDNGIEQLREKVTSSLPVWLCQYLCHMNAVDVTMLLRYCSYRADLNRLENDEIEAFTEGHKGFELCFVPLQRAVIQAIAQSPESRSIHPWLIEKVVQNRPWEALSPQQDCAGRKSIQNKIRRLVAELIA